MYDDFVKDNIYRMCVKCDEEVVLRVADCAEISGKCFLHEWKMNFILHQFQSLNWTDVYQCVIILSCINCLCYVNYSYVNEFHL